MSAGIDLADALVGQDHGSEVANDIRRKLVLYHQRGCDPSQFSAVPQMASRSDRIQTALAFAKENLKDALSVAVLAEVAQLSPRQFTRVFREETGGDTPAERTDVRYRPDLSSTSSCVG